MFPIAFVFPFLPCRLTRANKQKNIFPHGIKFLRAYYHGGKLLEGGAKLGKGLDGATLVLSRTLPRIILDIIRQVDRVCESGACGASARALAESALASVVVESVDIYANGLLGALFDGDSDR